MVWKDALRILALLTLVTVSTTAGAQATVSVNPPAGDALEAGATATTVTFTRSDDAGQLRIEVEGTGTATWNQDLASTDLLFLGGARFRVTFAPGETAKVVTLTPDRDNRLEGTETFTFTIQPPSPAGDQYVVGAPDRATVNIIDDVPVVSVAIDDGEATEAGATTASLIFTRTDQGDVAQALTVALAASGSATYNQDLASGDVLFLGGSNFRVTIPANDLSKTVVFTPDTDNLVEGTETFGFAIQAPVVLQNDYTIGTPDNAAIDIIDDAPVVTLSLRDASVREKGETETVMTVSRTNQGDVTATLRVEIDGSGTGTWNQDLFSSDITFAGGSVFRVFIPQDELSLDVLLNTAFDAVDEGDETFRFELQPPLQNSTSEYLIGDPGSGDLLIIDVGSLVFKDGIEEDESNEE